MEGNKMKHIAESLETFMIEGVISSFLKLIDDYKVLDKLKKFGVGDGENEE